MDPSADEVISSLMGSSDAESLMEAVKRLTNLMDEAYGAAAAGLAGALRQAGAVGLICELLNDPAAPVHRRAMAILGNLVADVFDPLAFESVVLAKASGVLPKLLVHLSKPFPNNLYAGACLQNMTAVDGDACDYLSKHDAAPVLEAMLSADDDQVCVSRMLPAPPDHHRTHRHLAWLTWSIAHTSVATLHSSSSLPRARSPI